MLKAKTLLSFEKRKGFRKHFCINFNTINLNNIELQDNSFKKLISFSRKHIKKPVNYFTGFSIILFQFFLKISFETSSPISQIYNAQNYNQYIKFQDLRYAHDEIVIITSADKCATSNSKFH